MKFNKMRIAALAMAAVMTAASVSPVWAEDLLTSGDAVEDIIADELSAGEETGTEPVVENTGEDVIADNEVENDEAPAELLTTESEPLYVAQETRPAEQPATAKKITDVVFHYNDSVTEAAGKDYVVTYKLDGVEKTLDDQKKITKIDEVKKPTCTTGATFRLSCVINDGKEDKTFESKKDKPFTVAGTYPKGHRFVKQQMITQNYGGEKASTPDQCINGGEQYRFFICDDCGKSAFSFAKYENGVLTFDTTSKAYDAELAANVEGPIPIEGVEKHTSVATQTYYVFDSEGDYKWMNAKADREDGIPISDIKQKGYNNTTIADVLPYAFDRVYTRKPLLEDDNYNGYYYIVVFNECSVCDYANWELKPYSKENDAYPIYATRMVRYRVGWDSYDKSNILDIDWYDSDKGESRVTRDGVPEEFVTLADCTEKGTYKVYSYAPNVNSTDELSTWQIIETKEVTVAPHHKLAVAVEFSDEKDMKRASVTWKNGVPTVTNNDCSKPLTYKLVYHCVNNEYVSYCDLKDCDGKYVVEYDDNANDVSGVIDRNSVNYLAHTNGRFYKSESKTADESINHVIDQKTYNTLKAASKDGAYLDISLIAPYEFDQNKYIKLENATYTCADGGKAGSVDVLFYCTKCGKYVSTLNVNVKKPEHIKLDPKEENYVAPTCAANGHFDAVTYCKRCNEVLERRDNVQVTRLPHSNEAKVDVNGIGTLKDLKDVAPQFELLGDVVVASGKGYNVGDEITYGYVGSLFNTNYYQQQGVFQDYAAYAAIYSVCDVCGEKIYHYHPGDFEEYFDEEAQIVKKSSSRKYYDSNEAKSVIKVEAVTPQGKVCQPGSITLSASVTYYDKNGKLQTLEDGPKTFEYYTSATAYQSRTTHNYGPVHYENVKEDGSYDEVYYCTICGEKIEVTHHDAGPFVLSFEVADVSLTVGETVDAAAQNNSTRSVEYKVENPEVATINETGMVTGVSAGTTTVTATLLASETETEPIVKTFVVTVKPAKTVVLKLRDEGAGTMHVKWRIVHGVDGYQFAWATDPEFTDIRYSAAYGESKNTQRRYSLESATYYVKARTFVLDSEGNRLYSNWSGVKAIDISRFLQAPQATCTEVGNNKFAFEVTRPVPAAAGYQISIDGKTASYVRTKFTRQASTAGDEIKIRAYAYAEDGKYFSDWVVFE